MKKRILLVVLVSLSYTLTAQIYHEKEKEALREVLRQTGCVSGMSIHLEPKCKYNYQWCSLTEADTLNWYNSEEWLHKLKMFTWNDKVPKRVKTISLNFYMGLSDLSVFEDLEELSSSVTPNLKLNAPVFDISKNEKLRSLQLGYSYADLGQLAGNNNIEYLSKVNCNADTRAFPRLKNLFLFDMDGYQPTLDFSDNPLLETLIIGCTMLKDYNRFDKINLKENKNLKSLDIQQAYTGEAPVDLSQNTLLEKVRLSTLTETKGVIFPNTSTLNKVHLSYIVNGNEYNWDAINPDTLIIDNSWNAPEQDYSHMTNLKYLKNTYMWKFTDISACHNLDTIMWGTQPPLHLRLIEKDIHWEDGVDLSNFLSVLPWYMVPISEYKWEKSENGSSERIPLTLSGDQGRFELTEDLLGKTLYCTMNKNDLYTPTKIESIFHVTKNSLSVEQGSINAEPIRILSSVVRKTESIIIQSFVNTAGSARLYDMWGNTVVRKRKIAAGSTEITSPTSTGIYLLNIQMDDGQQYSFKIIVQ